MASPRYVFLYALFDARGGERPYRREDICTVEADLVLYRQAGLRPRAVMP